METNKIKTAKMSNATEQTIFVRNLIDSVREHRCLYDKKDTAYFNRREKEKAWQRISQKLGRSDVACHRRWKLLREKFAKELKKRDRMLKNGERFQSDWTCFDNIMYIEEHIAPRKKSERECGKDAAKRTIYEHSSSADTTSAEKRPYCPPTGLDFLAQLSKARLQQATQIAADSQNSFAEIKRENDDCAASDDDEVMRSPTPNDSIEEDSSRSSSSAAAAAAASTSAVDALLRELSTNKETNLNFVKNLTNALKINNLDIFKENPQIPLLFPQPSSSSRINENTAQNHATTTTIPEAISMPLKHAPPPPPINDEIVRSTLLRVNGINNLVSSNAPNENITTTEVSSSANLPTIDIKDEIFGKMVVTMLGDITDEECKDDAKFGIMQVLINAKRACRNKQLNRP